MSAADAVKILRRAYPGNRKRRHRLRALAETIYGKQTLSLGTRRGLVRWLEYQAERPDPVGPAARRITAWFVEEATE